MTLKRGGLFAVIEDTFYKLKPGSESEEIKEAGQQRRYLDSDQIRNESAYLHTTPETAGLAGSDTLQLTADIINKDNESPQEKITLVSLASSLGPVTAPQYPHRPSLAPVTLQSSDNQQRNIQPRRYDQYRNNKHYSDRRKEQNNSYFKSHRKQYDPFAFQTTPRPIIRDQAMEDKRIFSNRLDSRFSIQVVHKITH